MKDPTKRFSDRVEEYIKYRPGYPQEIIGFLKEKIGLMSDWTVADIGSGTGSLSRLFLENGNLVYGVEPNNEMREAGAKLLGQFQKFISINGKAEATKLKLNSINLITAGQAFHWFNVIETKNEFSNILLNGGWVTLIWNTRKMDVSRFSKEYESLVTDFAIDYKAVDHKNINDGILSLFFKVYRSKVFQNYQELDLEGLKGRLMSSSYLPDKTSPAFAEMMTRTESIFRENAQNGKIRIEYDTELYYGKVK